MDILGILLRWTHIVSMSFLAGSMLYYWFVLSPSLAALPAAEQSRLSDRIATALKPWVIVLTLALVGAGLANFFRKTAVPKGYHMWFGIKVLLALHIIAVAILMTKQGVDPAKRARWAAGTAISALITIAISAYLRTL